MLARSAGTCSGCSAEPASTPAALPIKAGQEIAGVCEGVSAYTEIDVAWVRTIFLALALVTAGIFILVYLALVFVLPITATRETWVAELDDAARAAADGRV